MRKNGILIFMMILVMFFALSACSGSDKQEEGQAKTEGSAKEKAEKKQEDTNGNQTIYPLEIEITDAMGNVVTQIIEQEPERIITNNLSTIEILLQLGLKDKIVGITQPDNKVTGEFGEDVAELFVIGDKMTVSKEVIAEHTPDIVIGRSMAFNDESIGAVDTLNDLGIQVYIQTASDMTANPPLTAVIDDVLAIGEIFNVNERAKEYAQELEDRHAAVVKQVQAKKGTEEFTLMPIVAYDAENASFAIFNISGGLQADLLKQLNITPSIQGSSADPSLETIISANPDIILYVEADRNAELDKVAIDKIMNEPLLKEVSAIKENRVYKVTYDDFMDYGVRIFDTFEMLGERLYGK